MLDPCWHHSSMSEFLIVVPEDYVSIILSNWLQDAGNYFVTSRIASYCFMPPAVPLIGKKIWFALKRHFSLKNGINNSAWEPYQQEMVARNGIFNVDSLSWLLWSQEHQKGNISTPMIVCFILVTFLRQRLWRCKNTSWINLLISFRQFIEVLN